MERWGEVGQARWTAAYEFDWCRDPHRSRNAQLTSILFRPQPSRWASVGRRLDAVRVRSPPHFLHQPGLVAFPHSALPHRRQYRYKKKGKYEQENNDSVHWFGIPHRTFLQVSERLVRRNAEVCSTMTIPSKAAALVSVMIRSLPISICETFRGRELKKSDCWPFAFLRLLRRGFVRGPAGGVHNSSSESRL